MTRRVAVTGASGFIGRHVVKALEDRGDRALAIGRPFDRANVAKTIAGCDAIVHLAGVVSAVRQRDFYDANVASTRVVAEAAADAAVRMVHISSLAAAGPAPPAAPRREEDPPAPINDYGKSKLEGERAVQSVRSLRWTILRPGVVYGPGDRAIQPLFALARLGIMPLVGNETAAYTFIYVDDAVRAMLDALDGRAEGRTIFLGHREPVSPRLLMETIRQTAGSRAAIFSVPRSVIRALAEIGELTGPVFRRPATLNRRRFGELYSEGFVCQVDRMQELLGVTAEIGLQKGLQMAAGWYTRA